MKTRVISALILMLLFIPILIIGGVVFNTAVFIIALISLKEFLDIKELKKKVPIFIKFISYIFLVVMIGANISKFVFNSNAGVNLAFQMDYRIISGLFLAFLVPTILYHNKDKYSINDAFYLIGGIFFLSLPMTLLIFIRQMNINLLIYLLLIAIMTDTYAYLAGRLIGKSSLIEEVSPKKTWEGTVFGTIFGVFISTVFYITVINSNANILYISLIGLFLSMLGQFGDLFFSTVKRYYGKKDFSNLIPGHGGILDRIDSIIFVILGFVFFISIL